jgi:hypothetical protein
MTKQNGTETTTTNQASPAHPAIEALNQHGPMETLEAVQLLRGLTEAIFDALPERTQRTLTDYHHVGDPITHADAHRVHKAAQRREDAASYAKQVAKAEQEAAALEAMAPEEWALVMTEAAAKQAKRDAQWEKRQGAGTVSVSVWMDTDVDVNKEDLANAGYHHKSDCPAGENPLEPNHQLIQSVWDQLRDFHDRHHGLTLWQNCPHNPCKGIPEAFQREPWMHQVPDTDY